MQENLVFRKRDLTIVQGAAFRVQKRGNNTYSIEADGSAFEDVVILVRNALSVFYSRICSFVVKKYTILTYILYII